jgi:hypothetical protein
MKAVIFARVSTQEQEADGHSIDAQIAKLREYCEQHSIEIIKEIHGKVNLAEIDFSEQIVVLGVSLDFGKDFKYVDENNLDWLLPQQLNKMLFHALDWCNQPIGGYFEVLEYGLVEKSSILEKRFAHIANSNEDSAFDDGLNLAKKANPDWSIELVYGFNLLEGLVQRKLNNSTIKGKDLYEALLKNTSFKNYLENYIKDSGIHDYHFALQSMVYESGSNYRNILAHDLFIKCLDMDASNQKGKTSQYAIWEFHSHKFWSDIRKIKELYRFIQKWN